MPETVAVQVMPGGILLARAKGSSEGAALTELVFRAVGAEEIAQDVAVAMVRERGIQNIGLAVLVNWDQYSLRDAWLPFTNAAQIRNTIKFELEDDLDLAANDMVMPFQVIEQRPEASHMLVWAAKKQTLADLIASWENAGLSPEYMPPDAVGHLGLVEALAADLIGKPVVVVSGNEHNVELTLIHERQIWARRRFAEFTWATDAAGWPLQEMRRTFLSAPSFPVPEAVISFGGEPADTLAKVIAQELECPQRSVALPDLGEPRFLYWPAVAGVALLTARGTERPLSFRIEEFEPKESGQAVTLLALVATALLGVVMLVGGFMFYTSKGKVQTRAAEVQGQLDTYWSTVNLPKDQKPRFVDAAGVDDQFAINLSNILQLQTSEVTKRLTTAKVQQDAGKRFRAMCEVLTGLPPGITLDLNRVSIGAKAITISSVINSYQATTDLGAYINGRKDKAFVARSDGVPTKIDDDHWRFNLILNYTDVKGN